MRNWEATFIDLWQQGLEITAIAQRLGVPKGTVQSRAHRLQQQGKIQPRGRGGAYPRQKALARQASAKVSTDTPGVSTGVSSGMSTDTQQMQYLPPRQETMQPLLQDILLELRHLTGALASRVSTDTSSVSSDTPQMSPDTHGVSRRVSERTPLPPDRGKSIRWNLHLSERLREQIKAMAAARGLQDSQMVEELLWKALNGPSSSTP